MPKIYTWTNGVSDGGVDIPSAPVVPLVLSKTAFLAHCESKLGGGATGRTRFGKIRKAIKNSNDDEIEFVNEWFIAATTIEKAKADEFLALLVSKGTALVNPAVLPAERSAIIDGWPEG